MSSSSSSSGGDNFLTRVLHILAGTLGLIGSFFITPLIYESSRDGVFNYAHDHYWDWLAYPVVWLWFLVVFAAIWAVGHLIMLGVIFMIGILTAKFSIGAR